MCTVNCTRTLKNPMGNDVVVTFDNIGLPSIQGMQILCARRPEEVVDDMEAWDAERLALMALGFEIIEMQNAIIIFEPTRS